MSRIEEIPASYADEQRLVPFSPAGCFVHTSVKNRRSWPTYARYGMVQQMATTVFTSKVIKSKRCDCGGSDECSGLYRADDVIGKAGIIKPSA